MDAAVAEVLLKEMLDWQADPALGQPTVDILLQHAAGQDAWGNLPTNIAVADAWASGNVVVGQTIVDSNGRYWKAIQPGVTSGTEPVWPTMAGLRPGGSRITDGSVVWLDVGSSWAPTYSLDVAAAMGWRIKAGKCASRFSFMTDGQQVSRNQVHAMCMAMAQAYERRCAHTVEVLSLGRMLTDAYRY
jgi:hypothetical protein